MEDHNSAISDVYALKTGHLTEEHGGFFKEWEHLISLEETELGRWRKEIWTMGAAEREQKGRCFSSMIIDRDYDGLPFATQARDNKFHRLTYRFIRSASFRGKISLLSGFINVGDPINVSVEPHLLAISRGFVLELSPDAVVIGIDHELSKETLHNRLSGFGTPPPEILFRLDKDELFGGLSRIRENLAIMFYADGDTKRLQLVVELRPPMFVEPEPLVAAALRHTKSLNESQQKAIHKVLSAEDYALILGMPGTGKTTVIATLIRVLAALGKSVLLTSYTHSAVDTILLKLKDVVDFNVLRLGNVDKVCGWSQGI